MEDNRNGNTKEFSIIKCKHCGKECKRILASLYPNKKDKKWVDESGREFNGHVCPPCNSERKALKQKLKRRLKAIEGVASDDSSIKQQ